MQVAIFVCARRIENAVAFEAQREAGDEEQVFLQLHIIKLLTTVAQAQASKHYLN